MEIDLGRAGNEVRLKVSDTHGGNLAHAARNLSDMHRFDPATLRTILEENQGRLPG